MTKGVDVMTHGRPITMRALVALAVLSVAGLSACTSAGASTAPSIIVVPPPSAAATAEPSASEAPSAAASEPADASAGPTAVATSIDPCQLVPPSEVATVTGFEWGSDSPGFTTMDNNGRDCSYGQEGYGFDVIVVQAPDAATAKAQEPAFKAQLEEAARIGGAGTMKLTEMPDFMPGVDAAILHGSATAEGVALYALKGPVLLALTELSSFGGPVATDAAMEAEAKTALGRIP
jgi:hypothetical protein